MATVAIGETHITSGQAPTLARGQVIKGRYRLGEPLGSGGMGAVYAAEHIGTGRPLALKVLKPEVARRPEMVHRFLSEARAAAAVPHPAIVEIVDLDQDGDLHYIVMERLAGEELAARMRREGPLPIPSVVRLGIALADAMSAAHRHQPRVIHRDLKPENVFLARGEGATEVVKILDFGIAKLIEPDGLGHGLTLTGEVCGTPVYMSPEQLHSARDVDERTDIYAIGVILYQALAGRLPFQAESFADLVLQVNTQRPPPLLELRPEVPPSLARTIEAALARDREERIATAAELLARLARCLREPADLDDAIPIPADPRPPARPAAAQGARWLTWVVAAVAGLAIGLGLALVASDGGPARSHGERSETGTPTTPVSIRVSSVPAGARIYRRADNAFLGTTDTILTVSRDGRESLLFRKGGYRDEVRDTNGDSLLVILRPNRR